jgi:glyoxylase-like metal-dependent hydrolase (beta-lactamase superfamily II)
MKFTRLSFVLFTISLYAIFTGAQTVTEESYAKAREVIDKAVTAYGGIDELRAIDSFTIKASGESVHRNQSRKPFMSEKTPYQIDIVADLKGNRMSQIVKGGYPGGFSYHNGFSVVGTDGVGYDFDRKVFSPRPNAPPAVFRQRLRYLPQMILLNAVDRASRLRSLGRVQFLGRAHDVVSYSNDDGAEVSLYFEVLRHTLTKYEILGTDPFMGDVVTEFIFGGYKTESGIPIAVGRTTRVGGELTEELRYDAVGINPAIDAAVFKVPEGFTETKPPAPSTDPVTKLGENVYTVVANGYNVMFVGFKDYVFVMETPGNDAASNRAIEAIKKTFPGKPIKYVAATHHHDDHAGGLRRYIAEGATIIALPGERSFFEKVAKSKFTIDPDQLTRTPKPLNIEIVEGGKRVLSDGTMTVELIDIGSGPHTDAMLVAYVPREKILFQGDLLNRPANGDYPIANDTTVHFANWLEASKLPVERIVAVHGTVSTMDELKKAVAEKLVGKK